VTGKYKVVRNRFLTFTAESDFDPHLYKGITSDGIKKEIIEKFNLYK
jgi:hypothetical protein